MSPDAELLRREEAGDDESLEEAEHLKPGEEDSIEDGAAGDAPSQVSRGCGCVELGLDLVCRRRPHSANATAAWAIIRACG